jgi:hypothetical protein
MLPSTQISQGIQRLESRVFRTRSKTKKMVTHPSTRSIDVPLTQSKRLPMILAGALMSLVLCTDVFLVESLIIPSNRWLSMPSGRGGLGVVLRTFLFRRCPGQTRNAQKSKSSSGFSGAEPESPKSRKVEKRKSGHFHRKVEK